MRRAKGAACGQGNFSSFSAVFIRTHRDARVSINITKLRVRTCNIQDVALTYVYVGYIGIEQGGINLLLRDLFTIC